MLAALGQWWEASLRIDPERVPRWIYGNSILDPLFRKMLAGWLAFATKVLFWPIVKRQRTTNALLWRIASELSELPSGTEDSHYISQQLDSLGEELRRIGKR